MDSPPSSPARSTVKVTYLERQKKKKTIRDSNDEFAASQSSSTTKHMDSPLKSPAGSPKSMLKVSESMGPKKIDFRVPDPPSKRTRRNSNESDGVKRSPSSSKAKKSNHIHSSSSISSLSRVVQQMAASPVSSKKPPSVASKDTKPSQYIRSMTPDTEMDDTGSIAESTTSVSRIRRTEAERLQYFENQPECGKIEPHRAHCTRCNKFVSLGNKQTYTVRPWENHRTRCDKKLASGQQKADEGDGASVAPSASERTIRRTESERKTFLESDDRAEDVQPDKIKCRKCQKTIRLSTLTKYSLGNWDKHQTICGGTVPSNRIATAERKLRIVNDSKAKSFGPRNVVCAICDVNVTLDGDGDYNLTTWEEHKSRCSKTNSTGTINSLPFPSQSDRSPLSSVSTEGTVIPSEPSTSVPSPKGIKRAREEPELAPDDEDVRPATRPRTETYNPPQTDAPSALGWFMLPFKAFVRGFRESLKGAGDSS